MVLHEMNHSKTLNNKYVPEADSLTNTKNSPHYKLKFEMHIFEQRICIILALDQKGDPQIPVATQHGRKKKKSRSELAFVRLSPIRLGQIKKKSCLITQLCIPVLNTGTKQILKL
jgi:hypothetical protein